MRGAPILKLITHFNTSYEGNKEVGGMDVNKYLACFLVFFFWGTSIVSCRAEERQKSENPVGKHDWYIEHRKNWENYAMAHAVGLPPAVNSSEKNTLTFIRSAYFNTLTVNSEAYKTREQRLAYYDLISRVLEDKKSGASSQIRNVKFLQPFRAQLREYLIGDGSNDMAPCGSELNRIQVALFHAHMQVLDTLLFTWREPRDPFDKQANKSIPALKFDLRMVAYDNKLLKRMLDKRANELVTVLAGSGSECLGSFFISKDTLALTAPWLRALGIKHINLMDYGQRLALGLAVVFHLHGKTRKEYMAYMGRQNRLIHKMVFAQ